MNRFWKWDLVIAGLTALVVLPTGVDAQSLVLKRLVAESDYFANGPVTTSDQEDAPVTIYSKTLLIPHRTVYVSIFATGSAPQGEQDPALELEGRGALQLNCYVDGVPCTNNGDFPWIRLLEEDGVLPSNRISYQWCATVMPNETYTIELKMASDSAGEEVSLEAAQFYIDTSTTKCNDLDAEQR
jgi:hypothetical protein